MGSAKEEDPPQHHDMFPLAYTTRPQNLVWCSRAGGWGEGRSHVTEGGGGQGFEERERRVGQRQRDRRLDLRLPPEHKVRLHQLAQHTPVID